MGSFAVALRSELYLALRGRGLRVLLVIPAAAAVLRIALGELQSVTEQAREALRGGAAVAAVELNAHASFVDGSLTGLILAYLMIVALAAHGVASDRDTGIIRHLLIRRVSRVGLVIARFVFLLFVGLVMVAVVLAAAWGCAALFHDFTAVIEDGYEIIGPAEMREEILRGLGLAIVPLPAAVGFGILISVCARSATQAVAVALGLILAFDLFKPLLGDVSLYVYAFYHPSLVDESYLGEVARIVRGFSDVFVEEGVTSLNVLVPVPETLVFLVIAAAVAARRRM